MPFIRLVARCRVFALVTLGLLLVPVSTSGDDTGWLDPPGWSEWIGPDGWMSYTIRGQDGLTSTPTQTPATERAPGFYSFGPRSRRTETPEGTAAASTGATAEQAGPTPSSPPEIVAPSDVTLNQTPDVGSTIERSDSVQTVNFRQNSPLSRDPYIRTYRDGQVYTNADGLFWAPIRPDLDSMINRIDPSLYQELSIVPGPYGLRYGPGFGFLNVQTVDTPRNPNGYESHYRTGLSTRTNGGQLYGRETVFGGGCDWGYIVHYGNRVGSDYEPGGSSSQPPVPASYKSQNFLGQIGFDLSPDSKVEFRARRLDDTDTQYALQFFDVDFMGSDAYSLHYNWEDPCGSGTLSAMGWYSRSRMFGNTTPPLGSAVPSPNSPYNMFYNTLNRVNAALDDELAVPPGTNQLTGATSGHYAVTGARLNRTWGELDSTQLSTGLDVRYINQRLTENFEFTRGPLSPGDFSTNLPFANMVDPGAYSELTVAWLPYLSSTVGGRVDLVNTNCRADEIRTGPQRSNLEPYRNSLDQNDTLLSFYVANELEISENWGVRLALGYAERPPTLLERYADGIFLGVVQSGYSRVIGTPTLNKEENWQVDLSLTREGEGWRGRAAAFYAWTDDPIVFLGFPVKDPTGAYLLRYINGELFTRTGFELAGEYDNTSMLTTFGTLHYLSGRDLNILLASGELRDQPMTGVSPLEGRAGLRVHDANHGEKWGVELGMRMVRAQDSTGGLRVGFTQVSTLDPNFEKPTPGFTVFDLRSYYNVTPNLYLVGGVDNLFDRTYLEHLNLRMPSDTIAGTNFPAVAVLSPGITPYVGVEWNY